MKTISKILIASAFIALLATLYYINNTTGTLEKITTGKQTLEVIAPQPGKKIKIGDTYTLAWKELKNIPDSAILYATLSGGPTPGVIIDEPYPESNEITWDAQSSRGDDVVTRLKPGTYSLHLKVYKRSFCDQALCWDRMPNSAQVPVIAESKDIEITLAAKE